MSKSSKLKKDNYIEAFIKTRSVTKAAKHAGVSRNTVYKWQDEDPEFVSALEARLEQVREHNKEWLNEQIFELERKVFEEARNDARLALTLLERIFPERYNANITERVAEKKLSGSEDGMTRLRRFVIEEIPKANDGATNGNGNHQAAMVD